MKTIAVIPARGGSKGIKQKNIYLLAGKPLISYTIEAAIDSHVFDRIIVSTDCKEISAVARECGAEIIHRPASLAGDKSRSEDAILHVLEQFEEEAYQAFMLLQPTSPLRKASHIQQAMSHFQSAEANSLVSVCELSHPVQKCLVDSERGIVPVTNWDDLSKPRQELPKSYQINGAIYISRVAEFLKSSSLYEQPVSIYEMPASCSLDIDRHEDVDIAEKLIKRQASSPSL